MKSEVPHLHRHDETGHLARAKGIAIGHRDLPLSLSSCDGICSGTGLDRGR
ncbi:hypothetical protein [Bradyrhizobium sp. STM 3566]|uniref:hypothetical protein n=1 Tax=Bradyrhizobium sp. STM 3566 TaxID=578928 RepID=UPI00388D8643